MKKSHRKCRADGGNISEKELSRGDANGVISGNRKNMPSESLSLGKSQAMRSGKSSKALALGMPTGRTMSTGGRAVDSGDERLAEARKRNEILGGVSTFAEGGPVFKRMKSLYKALHGHFEQEPQMKKLHVRKMDVYEGEPHRESKKEMRRSGGGKMWIKGAIKHPGALHKELGVPKGKKIPVKMLEKAEHSRSPLMRKRANLAATLRKINTR